jgi:death-on-curing protein
MTHYLTVDEVIAIHSVLIDEFGGARGLRDVGALESAVMRPQSGYYKSIIEEASALMESLAINHPFVDGNKRVSFFGADVFLRMNGYYIDCDGDAAYEFIIDLLETNSFKYARLLDWIAKHALTL